jgi:hypothetical protein
LSFRFQVSSFRFRVSSFKFQVPSSKFQVPSSKFGCGVSTTCGSRWVSFTANGRFRLPIYLFRKANLQPLEIGSGDPPATAGGTDSTAKLGTWNLKLETWNLKLET